MSVRLARCPFCGKRIDVSGVPEGTRLKCGSCAALLSVPRSSRSPRLSRGGIRRAGLQIAGALVVSFGLASALYWVIRPSKGSPDVVPPAAGPVVAQKPEPKKALSDPKYVDHDLGTQIKLDLRAEFGIDRFRFREDCRPFFVAVERGERYLADVVIKEYATRLGELYQYFRNEFKLPPVDEVLPVLVLASRESYDAYRRRVNDGEEDPPQIRGVYEFTRTRIVTYHDPMANFEVILHEGVHQLVHHYTRRMTREGSGTTTQWFQEGIGTYFEGFRRAEGMDPAVNESRLRGFRHAVSDPNRALFTPINVLTGMTIDGFWNWYREQRRADEAIAARKTQAFYAESWALVYYLRSKGGNHRLAFDEYFQLELEGKGGKEGFERVIAKHLNLDLAELERELIDYIRSLP